MQKTRKYTINSISGTGQKWFRRHPNYLPFVISIHLTITQLFSDNVKREKMSDSQILDMTAIHTNTRIKTINQTKQFAHLFASYILVNTTILTRITQKTR